MCETTGGDVLTNAIRQMNLFEARRQLGRLGRFLVIGSTRNTGCTDELRS